MVSDEGARGHGHVEQVNADKQRRRSGEASLLRDSRRSTICRGGASQRRGSLPPTPRSAWCGADSVVPYILGHIIPVPSETGKSYGDLDEQYLTASYRVYLTEAQARNVFAYIKQKQAAIWQAGTVNCTGFISDVASYMGLRTPALPTLMYPEDLVKAIKELNGGRQEMPSYASAH
jgi:hypothetical protein